MGAAEAGAPVHPSSLRAPGGLAGCAGCGDKWQRKQGLAFSWCSQRDGGGGGDGLQAHLFLCLAGPRALFAQQHVVPQEEIKPALKVQGTAKLCWEVAGARAGMEQWSGWPADSLPESQKEGGLQARAVWDKVDCWALARNAHERTFCSQ